MRLVVPTVTGVAATSALLLLLFLLGQVGGRVYGPPWVCDATRYVDTVPTGRAVVGPALSAPPGCGP